MKAPAVSSLGVRVAVTCLLACLCVVPAVLAADRVVIMEEFSATW